MGLPGESQSSPGKPKGGILAIPLQVSDQDKRQIAALFTECQVLKNLYNRHELALRQKAHEILKANNMSQELYAFHFDAGQDIWEAQLKKDALSLPSQGIPNMPKN